MVSIEDEVELMRKILEGLHAIDRGILEGAPLRDALAGICRSLVEIFGLRLCWVGLLQEGSFEVTPSAWWGHEAGYLSIIWVAYDDSEYGKGPSGTAIKTKRPVIRNDIQGESGPHPWREEALKRGYRSSAAFPLVYEGHVMGVLNVYSAEPNFFDEKRVRLVQAFANQAAVLVSTARRLRALRESESRYVGLIEAASDAIVSIDDEGRIVLWNPATERMFGYTAREALGQVCFTLIVPEGYREQCYRTFERMKGIGGGGG